MDLLLFNNNKVGQMMALKLHMRFLLISLTNNSEYPNMQFPLAVSCPRDLLYELRTRLIGLGFLNLVFVATFDYPC